MPSPARPRFPDWAERERVGDLAWIGENLHVLWPAAQRSYEEQGRGAIVVDTLTKVRHQQGEGNPIFYMTAAGIEEMKDADALRMVRGYDASWELVTMLLKN